MSTLFFKPNSNKLKSKVQRFKPEAEVQKTLTLVEYFQLQLAFCLFLHALVQGQLSANCMLSAPHLRWEMGFETLCIAD